jgi:predicted HTH domain antitoxin
MWEALTVGARYRFYNLRPEAFDPERNRMNFVSECLLLQFQNGKSSFESVAEIYQTEKGATMDEVRAKVEKMGTYGKQMARREVWNGP